MQRSTATPVQLRRRPRGIVGRLSALVAAIALLVLGAGSAWAMAASPAASRFDSEGPAVRQIHRSAPLVLANGAPGDTAVSTTTIVHEGSEPGVVRLTGEVAGDLAPYLAVTIERGTDGATWEPEAGPAVFEGTLADLPANWASGLTDGRAWQPGERHTFRIAVTLLDRSAAQGRTAEATFSWEIRPAGA